MQIEQIKITTEYIQLDQLLKFANVISTGGQVKFLLSEQSIFVNNELCHEKRKKIRPGDVVQVADVGVFEVVSEEE